VLFHWVLLGVVGCCWASLGAVGGHFGCHWMSLGVIGCCCWYDWLSLGVMPLNVVGCCACCCCWMICMLLNVVGCCWMLCMSLNVVGCCWMLLNVGLADSKHQCQSNNKACTNIALKSQHHPNHSCNVPQNGDGETESLLICSSQPTTSNHNVQNI